MLFCERNIDRKQAAYQAPENSTTWKQQPIIAKPLKEGVPEAEVEPEKVVEEDSRRKKNLIIRKTPESKAHGNKITCTRDEKQNDQAKQSSIQP